LVEICDEREDLFWGKGVQVSFIELNGQSGKEGPVGFEGAFFSNEACDTPANNGCLQRLSWRTSSLDFS
jgi:hypothetical protein